MEKVAKCISCSDLSAPSAENLLPKLQVQKCTLEAIFVPCRAQQRSSRSAAKSLRMRAMAGVIIVLFLTFISASSCRAQGQIDVVSIYSIGFDNEVAGSTVLEAVYS